MCWKSLYLLYHKRSQKFFSSNFFHAYKSSSCDIEPDYFSQQQHLPIQKLLDMLKYLWIRSFDLQQICEKEAIRLLHPLRLNKNPIYIRKNRRMAVLNQHLFEFLLPLLEDGFYNGLFIFEVIGEIIGYSEFFVSLGPVHNFRPPRLFVTNLPILFCSDLPIVFFLWVGL